MPDDPQRLPAVEAASPLSEALPTLAPAPVPPAPKPLTRRQRRFVAEYLKDFNATAAAIRAGYKESCARQWGFSLLKFFPTVRTAIAEALAERQEREAVERERLIRAIEASAYADIRRVLNPDGSCKSALELDDETAAAVESMDVQETVDEQDGKRVVTRHTRIRLVDRTAARNQLAEILGLVGKGRLVGLTINNNTLVNVSALPTDPVAASLAYSKIINGHAG
jgi:phage terminase small subunit